SRRSAPTLFPYTTLFRSLIDEAAGKDAEERLRIRGPDARGRLRAGDLPHAAVERVEGFMIGHEHDGRRDERARDLRERVRQHFRSEEHTSELQSPDHLVC